MRFDLTDLRLFLNIHEAGTITGGAEASHMTLASASERVRGMEDTLGAPLLLRERRGVRLTPAGHTLLHHARLVVRQIDVMQGELGDFGEGLRGHVRMQCNTSAMSEHLPGVLSGFLAAHPRISVDLEERGSTDVADALRHGVCEVGMLSDAVDLDGLEVFPFRSDPLVLLVPRDHVLASHRSVNLADVVQAPFVGLTEGSALQETVAQQARRLGHRLDYRVRLRSLDSVCRLVGLGIGLGVVPRAVALRCARTMRVKGVPLSGTWAARSLVLCVRRMDTLSPPARQLVAHVLASSGSGSGKA